MSSTWSEVDDLRPQPCWLDRVNWLAAVLTPREATRLLLQLDVLLSEGEHRMGRQLTDDERSQVAQLLRQSAMRDS
jgi:hypothetical protein